MAEFIVTSVMSFISTNIDNIFVMMLLFAQVGGDMKKRHVVIGQYIGIGILVAVSILGAFGMNFLPEKYVGLLGLVPIALGIKAWIDYKKAKAQYEKPPQSKGGAVGVAVVAVANGADNIGVYVPLFAGCSQGQLIGTCAIFALMMALWCFLGERIVSYPKIKKVAEKYKDVAIPVVLIALGIYIIIKSL